VEDLGTVWWVVFASGLTSSGHILPLEDIRRHGNTDNDISIRIAFVKHHP
jgi:hypothetical protein